MGIWDGISGSRFFLAMFGGNFGVQLPLGNVWVMGFGMEFWDVVSSW